MSAESSANHFLATPEETFKLSSALLRRKPMRLANHELVDIFRLLNRSSLECQQLVCRRFYVLIRGHLNSVCVRVVDVVKLTYIDTRYEKSWNDVAKRLRDFKGHFAPEGVDMSAGMMRTTNIDVFNNTACTDFRILRDGFYGGCICTNAMFLGHAVEIARHVRTATWLFLDSVWFPEAAGLLEVIQAFAELHGVHTDSYACCKDVSFVPETADGIRLRSRLETHALLRTCSDKGVRKLYDNSDHHTLAILDEQPKTECEMLNFCFGGKPTNHQRRELRLKAISVSAQFPRLFIERYQRCGGSALVELYLSEQPEIDFEELVATERDGQGRRKVTLGNSKCIVESRRLRLQEPPRGKYFFSIATLS